LKLSAKTTATVVLADNFASLGSMAVQLNHTIVAAIDAEASARWLAELLGLAEPELVLGYFWQIDTANGVGLDFAPVGDAPFNSQHYAFLISEAEFDEIHGRLMAHKVDFWADPAAAQLHAINHHDGGRGVYFLSNDGHFLEVITRPYGSGA
jgi:catechol 2,3-dioxygenase-like lactoylglutathione lyase family enzyme